MVDCDRRLLVVVEANRKMEVEIKRDEDNEPIQAAGIEQWPVHVPGP